MSRSTRGAVQKRRRRPGRPARRFLGNDDLFEAAGDRIAHAAFAPHLPGSLWHYTRWEGLVGILSSRKLWATDYRTQHTDELEFRHADSAILGLARTLAADGKLTPWQRQRLATWVDTLQGNPLRKASDRLFITSFCTRGDSKHMWQQFGHDAQGFAIELEILREEISMPEFGLMFMEVDYDLTSVVQRLRDVVLRTLDANSRILSTNPARAAWLTERQLWFAGARAAIQCKGASYVNDLEWRRVATVRETHKGLILDNPRRLEVPIRDHAKLPAVRTIAIGANALPDAEARIAQLLREQGYTDESAPRVVRAAP